MLILGEVHTGLLQHSTSLSPPLCRHILELVHGEPARQFERPIAYTVSPDLLAGVDCLLPTDSGAKVRGVGTVIHRAALTGGHVLQGSAIVHITRGTGGRRLPWPHYLARPGQVETIGKVDPAAVIRGFLSAKPGPANGALLDLGAISGRLMDVVQSAPELDRRPPFRMARTRLRWAAALADQPADPAEPAVFVIESPQLRTLRLRCDRRQAGAVAQLCEDLARHDWLLTTLLELVERARIGTGSPHTIDRLRPVVDHLLHLWLPGARVDESLLGVWEELERRPGFSRQWQALTDRVRDQLSLGILTLLTTKLGPSVSAL
ncbi:MAG TPA: SCO2521 family protein [Natronosporangium sp.]